MSSDGVFSSNLDSSPWKQFDLEDQLLYKQDGSAFNLSSLDWNYVKVYEYDENNSSEVEHDTVTTGRSIAVSIFAVIFFVGLVGNALVIYTVARYVTMRRVTYLYLLNLSVADTMYLLICLPTLSVSYAIVDWRFGKAFCKIENYLMSVSMSVSVLTIMATGLDRYIAVIYPLRCRVFRTTKKTVSVIGMTWILSLVIMAPRITIFEEVSIWHINGLITLCSRVQTSKVLQLDTSLNFVFMYLLPLLALSVSHSRIGRKLWKTRKPGIPVTNRRRMGMFLVRDRRRIAMMVFAITIVFAIGWLPIHVYHLAEDFGRGIILFGQVVDRGTLALFFSFGANAMNPIFYCLFSGSFRKHFKEVLQCWCARITPKMNTEYLGSEKVLISQVQGYAYQSPPQKLMPRPASLLPDSGFSFENTHMNMWKPFSPSLSSFHFRPILLPTESGHYSSCPDLHSSSLSVKDNTHIAVTSCDCPSSSYNRKGKAETLSSFLLPKGFVQPLNICRKHRHIRRNRSASFSCALIRCSMDALTSSRPSSFGFVSVEREKSEELESVEEKFETPMHNSDMPKTDPSCLQNVCHLTKEKQRRSKPPGSGNNSKLSLNNTSSGAQSSVNSACAPKTNHDATTSRTTQNAARSRTNHDGAASKTNRFAESGRANQNITRRKANHISCQTMEYRNNIKNVSLTTAFEDSTLNTVENETYARHVAFSGEPTLKLLQCDLVSCIVVQPPPLGNDVHKSTLTKSTQCPCSEQPPGIPSHSYLAMTHANKLQAGNNLASSKNKETTLRTNNGHDNLPPVD